MQNRVARRLAEARVTQSYAEQGRHALLAGNHNEALIYLTAADRTGDDSPRAAFMRARAAQPFHAERARLTIPSGAMWSAMFSHDGKRILTTDDNGARLWDGQTYQLVASLPHDGNVYDGSFTPDGEKAVTTGRDGKVKVWDAVTGAPILGLAPSRANSRRYFYVEISPDSTLIAAVSISGDHADVWHAKTGILLAELLNRPNHEPSLAFSADSRWLATSGGHDVAIFDTTTWQTVIRLDMQQTSALSFDPTGPRLATASSLGDTSIWEIPSGRRIYHLHETGGQINRVTYSPDGAFIATASRDSFERVWKADTGALQLELRNHRSNVPSLEFDASSRYIVSGGADGAVVISDVTIGVPVSVLEGPRGRISVVGFDPSSSRVIAASWDGTARVWDAMKPYHHWNSPSLGDDCIDLASLDGDQRVLVVSCRDNGNHVWDTAHDRLLADLPSTTEPASDFSRALPAVSAEADRVAIAIGSIAAIYALPGGRLVRTITHPAPVTAIAFAKAGHDVVSGSMDGALFFTQEDRDSVALRKFPVGIDAVGMTRDRRLLVAGPLGRLHVYDAETNTVLAELSSPVRIRSFRISPDERRLLAIPTNNVQSTAVLWDLEHYRLIARLEGTIGHVFSAHFVHDGDILTATNDGSPRIWDGETGQLERRYLGNDQYLLDAAMDSDGSTIVAAGGDGVLRFWDTSSGRLIWSLRAHRSGVAGVHYEGNDIVTRGFTGDVSRWSFPEPPSTQMIDRCVRCLPMRLDEETGSLVEQPPCDPTQPPVGGFASELP